MKERAKNVTYSTSDVVYALESAAEFLDSCEFPDGTGCQEAANREAAGTIRKTVKRLCKAPFIEKTITMPRQSGICR